MHQRCESVRSKIPCLWQFVFVISDLPRCWYVLIPTRKETSYSDQTLTFASHSKTIQKVVRPTRSLRQQWPPRRTKNCDLSVVFFSRVGLRTYQHPCTKYYAYSMAQQPLEDQGLLIIEASRSHSDTVRSVGLHWTSDKRDAETSTWQHETLTRDRHARPRRDSSPPVSKLAAADPRFRKRGHGDRPLNKIYSYADKWPFLI